MKKTDLSFRFVLGFIMVVISSSACILRPKEIDLPFQTIEQRETPGTGSNYNDRVPGLIIISTLEDADSVNGWISGQAQKELLALDYKKIFAIVAFQGSKPSGSYSIQVNRISRVGNSVNVYVQIHEPKPDEPKADYETSPYHLVIVKKNKIEGEVITFYMISDGSIIVSLTHNIP